MNKYDKRHGGPYDRGVMDCYYGRSYNPHYFVGKSYMSDLVEKKDMTKEELAAYEAGWEDNHKAGNFKDWG